jgi:hypothetical protein
MEAVCSPETLIPTYKSTWHHNPEDHYGDLHCCEKLKSVILLKFYKAMADLNTGLLE